MLLTIIAIVTVCGVYALIKQIQVNNQGRVKGVNVDLYEDEALTIPWTSQDWGMIEPNETKSKNFWVQSLGNGPITLSMAVGNWTPTEAPTYLFVDWNYADQVIEPDASLGLTVYLFCAENVTGIDQFTFDLTFSAEA